jgi:hypothetical protein
MQTESRRRHRRTRLLRRQSEKGSQTADGKAVKQEQYVQFPIGDDDEDDDDEEASGDDDDDTMTTTTTAAMRSRQIDSSTWFKTLRISLHTLRC